MTLRIVVSSDPSNPRDCPQAALLEGLFRARRLVNFVKAAANREFTTDGLSNCHEVATGLLVDLYLADCAAGWQWATGIKRFSSGGTGQHSWLEVEDWASDYIGNHDMMRFADRQWYRRVNHTRNVRLRDAEAMKRWVLNRTRLGK
jgi:hypothetical protein